MATNESLVFSGKSIIGPSSIVAGSVTFPQTTLQATGTTTLIGNAFVQGGALYPPGPMTAASTALSGYAYGNGTYIASAPEQSSLSGFQVWYPFDNSITTSTESAAVYSTSSPYAYSNTTPYAYSNTIDVPTTTTYNGVWHQLQMPSAIVLEYYTIFPRTGQETNRAPATWRVFGSNDGTNWYTIDAQSSITTWSAPQVSKTFYLSPLPATYSYFRLSVQNLNGSSGGLLDVAQWNLYGKPPVPAMSILGGDLAIASGGGLNVGPGTLGSNVVVFSNVSGGSNVFGMDSNATVIIGLLPSSNVNYGRGYTRTAKAGLVINSGGNATYPINLSLVGSSTPGVSYNNGIDFGGGGQGCVQIVQSSIGGGNGALSFNFNNSNGADGNIFERMRMTYNGLSVLTGANPRATVDVTGNLYVSNAVTATALYGNVIASNVVVTPATGVTGVNVTGNLYVSNAITTTNLTTAGFTSNVSNTVFNYDTLTIPFVSCTTMNVFSTSNLQVATLTGSAGQTSLNVTGNVYVSNALTTTNVFAATVSTTNPVSFRNRVINGDFLFDQRNSGASSTPATGPTRIIDRWKVEIFGTGRCLVGQNLGAFALPSGFTNYYGMKVTTTTAVGAGDYFFLSQVIEGVNTIDWQWGTATAKPITVSFWVQSSIAGTAGGFVRNAGSSASNYTRSYPFTFTITNTLTWEYKTVTIPGDTGTPWYTTQTDGVEFGIELWNGTTYQSAPGAWAAGNFTGPSGGTINYAGTLNSVLNITGVQVELGSVATQFERRLYNFELAACQRYYETTIVRVGGYNTSGAYFRGSAYFNTKKRTVTPTLTVVSPALETSNVGTLNFDNSNFDGSSARYLVPLTSTGDAYGQWKVLVDCDF